MKSEKDHLRIIPAPAIVFVFVVLGFGLNWILPFPLLTNLIVARLTGLIVIGVSIILGGGAIVEMRRLHTSPNPHSPATVLVESGVFRHSRNPVYLSLFLMYIGIAICVNIFWMILLSPVLFWSVEKLVVKSEEDYLEGRFGDVYLQYKRCVRRWI